MCASTAAFPLPLRQLLQLSVAATSAEPKYSLLKACSFMLAFMALGLPMPVKSADADVAGSKDHPMISRVAGSTIKTYQVKEFDSYGLIKGPVNAFQGKDPCQPAYEPTEALLTDSNSVPLEGKVWKLTYEAPEGRSTLEIIRSYQDELTKAGFQVLYQCAGRACGVTAPDRCTYNNGVPEFFEFTSRLLIQRANLTVSGRLLDEQRYLAARMARPEGDVYVSLLALALQKPLVRLDVVETKPMASGLVTVDAAAMAADIARSGRVALYGIYFDTDRAEIKAESSPTLKEIASYLQSNSKVRLFVVGHTDNTGAASHNFDLSKRRAESVVAALVSQFAIPRDRLEGHGVGPLAPVAPNTSDENKAKNRRVELVQR
jgi:outer membrane protein OmpA-like peptidoglycan-associated protein